MPIHVFSEIGKLKKVLLHRPGIELENQTPDLLETLLFDEIPYLKNAVKEHDKFAQDLRGEGAEVVYVEDLAAEALSTSAEAKEEFLKEFLSETIVKHSDNYKQAILEYLKDFKTTKELVDKIIGGIRKTEIDVKGSSLADLIDGDYPFLTSPMPNLLFTRDPFSTIGNGISLHSMYYHIRKRETLLAKYIFKYHPEYKDTVKYIDRTSSNSIEGGDVLVLSKNTLLIGASERTSPHAIEELATNLFKSDTSFNKVLAVKIPKKRSYMHLDTVFTQIDADKFAVFGNTDVMSFDIYELTKQGSSFNINHRGTTLKDVLSHEQGRDVTMFKCGGGDALDGPREQWTDGSNLLTVAPNKVVAYDRNHVSNKVLEDAGVEVIKIPSGELSRGRGGPRCMSMPLIREDI